MSIIDCIASNVVIASLLALVAAVIGRVTTKPQIAHALWILLLVKLMTPPIVHVPAIDVVFQSVAPESGSDSTPNPNPASEPLPTKNDDPVEAEARRNTYVHSRAETPGSAPVSHQTGNLDSNMSATGVVPGTAGGLPQM